VKNVKSRNKMHLQKLLAQSQMESLSDSEIFKGLKISSGAYSDAEDDNKFSKQGKNPAFNSESDVFIFGDKEDLIPSLELFPREEELF
jgi:hypothetical protein